MIRVVHNGRERSLDPAVAADLGAVVRVLLAPAEDPEVVVEACVDGRPLSEEEISDPVRVPISDGSEISIASRPLREVALSSLASAAEYAERVSGALREVAGLLRSGHVEPANDLMAQASDALAVLAFTLSSAAAHLGESGERLAAASAEVEPWLEELVVAQEQLDWVRTADCLEYELAPRVAAWTELCTQEAAAAAGEQHGNA